MFRRIIAACAFSALSLGCGVVLADDAQGSRLETGQPPMIIAHRSAVMSGFPENSLAWIQYGIERGVDVLHINVQKTADDRYVLMHDHTLNRTTNVEEVFPNGPPGGPTRVQRGGKDYVGDYTLADIRRLGIVNGADGGAHGVPTLGEAIDFVGGRAFLQLGLKSYEVDSLAAELAGHDTQNVMLYELYYSGTDQSKLRALAEATGLPVGVSLFRTRNSFKDLDGIAGQIGAHLKMVTTDRKRLTPEFMARMDELGLHLAISGWASGEDTSLVEADDPGPWLAVFELKRSVITDQPDLVLELMGR